MRPGGEMARMPPISIALTAQRMKVPIAMGMKIGKPMVSARIEMGMRNAITGKKAARAKAAAYLFQITICTRGRTAGQASAWSSSVRAIECRVETGTHEGHASCLLNLFVHRVDIANHLHTHHEKLSEPSRAAALITAHSRRNGASPRKPLRTLSPHFGGCRARHLLEAELDGVELRAQAHLHLTRSHL